MTIAARLRALRTRRGHSLTDVARRSGIATSSLSLIETGRRDPTLGTLERILDAEGLRLLVYDAHGRATVAQIAAAIARSEADGDWEHSYRLFVQAADDLAAAHGPGRLLLALDEPQAIGPEWDAALAGLAAWRLGDEALPLPAWVTATTGDPARRWAPRIAETGWRPEADRDEIPEQFLSRGVWVERGELASA